MKKVNQIQMHTNESGEASTRPLFLIKTAYGKNAGTILAILAIIILHSVFQFTFFRSEEISLKAEAISEQSAEIKSEKEQRIGVEIETEIAMKKPDIVKMPNAVAPTFQPEPKSVRSRVVTKKKEARLSEAQRLRRAEKILTGV